MSVLLEARRLSYAYPGAVPALDDLDLLVTKGRKLAILGPNGAGKTTLLLHLNGSLRAQSGRVFLDGAAMGYGTRALADWRRRVGLVLQDADDQLFAASVFEDVSFGPLNLGLSDELARQRVDCGLQAMGIVDLALRPTHMLSFGQKKRVAIAGALAMRPEILLLDEPTAGLDHHGARQLLAVLDSLSREGTTLAFSTHDVDLAYAFADEVALFAGGRMLAQGDTQSLLADSQTMERAGLSAPFVLQLGLRARALGLLSAGEDLPRSQDDALGLLDRLAGQT